VQFSSAKAGPAPARPTAPPAEPNNPNSPTAQTPQPTNHSARSGNVPQPVWEAAKRMAPGINFSLREKTTESTGDFFVLEGKTTDGKRVELQSNSSGSNSIVLVDVTKDDLSPPVRLALDQGLPDLQVERLQAGGVNLGGRIYAYRIQGKRGDGSRLVFHIDPFGKAYSWPDYKQFYVYQVPLDSISPADIEAANAAQPGVTWHTAELRPEGDKKIVYLYGMDTKGRDVRVAHAEGYLLFYTKVSAEDVPEAAKAAVRVSYPGFKANSIEACGANTPQIVYYRFPGLMDDEFLVLCVRPDGTKIFKEE
jgi:hypothetical protein